MSNFQQQLDEELSKRGLKDADDEAVPKSSEKFRSKQAIFSLTAFLKGLALCVVASCGLVGWALIQADNTQNKISEKLPSKAAVISFDASSDVQPTITMSEAKPISPGIEIKPTKAIPANEIEDVSKNRVGMVPAPVPSLYQGSNIGNIPMIRKEDGLTAFKAYKRPFISKANKPSLSFIVMDIGLSKKMTDGLVKNLPDEVSFAISPYTANLKEVTKQARNSGHEVWLMLPLETQTYPFSDPGPFTLLSNASVVQNKDRLLKLLASTEGYVGLIPPKDHVFKKEDANINPAIKEIFDRGLSVFDTKTTSQSFVSRIAEREGFPYGKNNFWLDDDLTPANLNQTLRQAVELAEARGKATVMLRPYPASIKALQKFLNSAAADKFQLAPASAVVNND